MGKDDWPEMTEAGALIDEAYRKGWLPRAADGAKAQGASEMAGVWEVVPLKARAGFYARFTPSGYAAVQHGPEFPTEAETQAWINARG